MKIQKPENKKIVLFVDDDLSEAKENEPITLAKLKVLAEKVEEEKKKLYNVLLKTKELSDKYGFELKIFLDEKSAEDFVEKNSKKIVMAIVDLILPKDATETREPGSSDFGYAVIENILDLPHDNLKTIGVLTIAKNIETGIETKIAQKKIRSYIHLLKPLDLDELEKRLKKGFREAAKGTRNRYCTFSGGDHICNEEYVSGSGNSVFFLYHDLDSNSVSEAIKILKKHLPNYEIVDWKDFSRKTNSNRYIFCKICDEIEGNSQIIALEGKKCNPNVMFEIGFSKAFGNKIKIFRFGNSQCPRDDGLESDLKITAEDLKKKSKDDVNSFVNEIKDVIKSLSKEDSPKKIISYEEKEEKKKKKLIVSANSNSIESDCRKIKKIIQNYSTGIIPDCRSIPSLELSKIEDTMKEILKYHAIAFCIHKMPVVDNVVIYEYIGYAVARSKNVSVVLMDESMDKPSDVEKIAFTIQSIEPKASLHEQFINKMINDE